MSITLDLSRAQPTTAAPVNLSGLTREGLRQALIDADICPPEKAKMRASQVWGWIHHFGVTDFAAMSNVAKETQAKLAAAFTLARPEIVERQVSNDGTRKWLIRTAPGIEIETVYIPDVGRAGALCVSSQVGCTLNCTFCHTGTQKLVRNLTAAEIVAQVQVARDDLGEWPSPKEDRRLSNIVFMGMGEPLYNLDHVADAIDIISDNEGIALSRRRITLSTSGVVPEIAKTAEEIGLAEDDRRTWVESWMVRIDRGEARAVVVELRATRGRGQKRVRRLAGYLERFRDCVHYDAYRERGVPIGSGEVESAHRSIPQKRMKLPGACWHPDSVNPMLALRVLRANKWWREFWKQKNAA